jgi:hypothetical protein
MPPAGGASDRRDRGGHGCWGPNSGCTTTLSSATAPADDTVPYRPNWGRWGANDSKGAINLITPEKIKEAAALVRSGRAVSLSRPYAPEQQYVRINDRRATTGGSSIIDYYGSNYHGVNVTHVDALSHVWDRGGMWNGRDPDKELDTFGPHFADIAAFSSGLITRGRVAGCTEISPSAIRNRG